MFCPIINVVSFDIGKDECCLGEGVPHNFFLIVDCPPDVNIQEILCLGSIPRENSRGISE